VRQLCVRTCLARGVDPRQLPAGPDELRRLAASADPADQRELLAIADRLAVEYAYRPADLAGLPLGEVGVGLARSAGQQAVVHSHGAIRCLERLLPLTCDGGFILANDYGQAKVAEEGDFQHQRFSAATFVGVNFALLRAHFEGREGLRWEEPDQGEAAIHARLLGRDLSPETVARFRACFDRAAREGREGPARRARECARHGRLEAALAAYGEALERQPANWSLLGEVAHVLTFGLGDAEAGLELARAAVALNPACSPELWNMLGDSLYALGRVEESRAAFLRALRVNPDDVRARYNLAFVHLKAGEHALALRRIAEALALDEAGPYREGLLRKQAEVLAELEQRHGQRRRLSANRISTAAGERQAAEKPWLPPRTPPPMTPLPSGGAAPGEDLDTDQADPSRGTADPPAT
jgi:tetratricopeptide (TPR) repeat protein